jgi:diguanylate cyclase (GGDEF)-like protein
MEWLGFHFFAGLAADRALLPAQHDPLLVILAFLVACATSYATLDIAERLKHIEKPRSRDRWGGFGALCLAGGVWTVHVISMRALHVPLKMGFDIPSTLVSMLLALFAGLLSMQALGREILKPWQYLIYAAAIGLSLSAMHYAGLLGQQSVAVAYFEPHLFGLSVTIAVGTGLLIVLLARYLSDGSNLIHQLLKFAASLLLSAEILGANLLGNWSRNLTVPIDAVLLPDNPERNLQISVTLALIALLLIAATISAAIADKKLQGKEHDLRRVNALLSQLDQARMSLQQVAHFDPLTNLINRRGFNQLFAERLMEHAHDGGMLAVMFLDIDHFKRINDSLGHDAGDELLKVVAERIRSATRIQDVVSRFGGDEFCILISLPDHHEEARHLAERILQKTKEPIELAGRRMVMTTSIGISVFPRDGKTCDELLKNADLALYQSKGHGRNRFNFFSPNLRTKASLELLLEEELRSALREESELQVYYQPIVDLRTGQVAKLEALVRWQHPQHGLLTPERFIGIAEANGLIADLDSWVLQRACRDLSELRSPGFDHLIIAVNCSALNLAREELHDEIEDALRRNGVLPRRLELEVTENALMGNISNTIQLLKRIRALGVSLSIDDFGTGYSSLAYLKRLPLDTVKIDRSFIIDIPQSPQDMEIVQAIIVMAHTLHLKVVTEGVESPAQLDFLSRYGCDYVQGYLFSKPMPLEQLRPLVQELNQRKPVIVETLPQETSADENGDADHVSSPWSNRKQTIHRVKD